jgi:excisionase family DNA binding protein
MDEPLLIRIGEAARLLGISRSKAYELARLGKLPGQVRIAGMRRVSRRALDTWQREQEQRGADALSLDCLPD